MRFGKKTEYNVKNKKEKMSVTRNDIIGFKVAYEQNAKEYSKEILGLIEKSKLLFENDKASLQSILKLMEDSDLDAIDQLLNELMEDVETVIEDNSRLEYSDKMNNVYHTQQITIVSIDTDEGVLEPLGVGEMLIEVRY